METAFHAVEAQGRWTTIALLLVLLSWESLAPYFDFFRGKLKERSVHLVRNMVMGIINSTMIALVFIAAWLWAADLALAKRFGLLYLVELPSWVHALGAVLLFDFWTYWWHRFNHVVPLFWRFHRVHHSDPHMDVTTATRFHFGEIFFSSVFRIPLILLFGAQLWHIALYELIMFPIVQFHHANIGLPDRIDRLLRILFVTPAMHKVHHSRLRPETDSNYTSLFSIWDRLFGSFCLRDDLHEIDFGLDGYDESGKQKVSGLIKTPFEN